ncbi:conserved exported hypothetical protein [Candidatus Sulfopaludibacter sp. SbA3]|nr:conserved exported hypothetical protein [Candidatus Sulfopaludibacter sp. SbA3]
MGSLAFRGAMPALCSIALFAQAPRAFEAASVKPSVPGTPSSFQTNPAAFTARSYSLQFLIPYAYHVAVYQLAHMPQWMTSEKYDIAARAPAGSSEDQLRLMLQALLIERFKLAFHRETKELSVYALVPAKEGFQLKVEKREKQEGDGRVGAGRGRAIGHMVSSPELAETLSLFLDRPVLDRTGIDGLFNFSLHWTPDDAEHQAGDQPGSPPITAAVQEQLGLRLVAQRAPVDLFVIDHVEQVPAKN